MAVLRLSVNPIETLLYSEGNLRFQIDWASLIVGSKFTVFALFYFVFEDNFPSTGSYLEGLIHGGAYFRNFTVFDYGGFLHRPPKLTL